MKEALKVLVVGENFWANEVEKSEKFLQVVLQWCAGNEQAAARQEHADDLREDRVHVLDAVGFVDDDVLEGKLSE